MRESGTMIAVEYAYGSGKPTASNKDPLPVVFGFTLCLRELPEARSHRKGVFVSPPVQD